MTVLPLISANTVTLSRSEGSVALDVEMLRGPQHDRINVFICINGPCWISRYPDEKVKSIIAPTWGKVAHTDSFGFMVLSYLTSIEI